MSRKRLFETDQARLMTATFGVGVCSKPSDVNPMNYLMRKQATSPALQTYLVLVPGRASRAPMLCDGHRGAVGTSLNSEWSREEHCFCRGVDPEVT